MRQTNTKEKILQISIEKISKKGYDKKAQYTTTIKIRKTY